jgi:hypothetical protein
VPVVSVAAPDAAVGRAELYDDEQLDLLDELDDDWVVDEPAHADGTASTNGTGPTSGTGPSNGTAATNGHPAAAPPDGDGR